MYVALCALAYFVAQREQFGLVTDARDATIRELMRDPTPADVLFLGSSATARGVLPAEFEARAKELSGESWRALNLAPFGAGRHIGFLELERWLDTHAAPRAVVVEVGVTSDLVGYMHQMLPRFMNAADCWRVVRERPHRYRDAQEMGRRLRSPALIDPWGAFAALDRFAMHLELALDSLGRGPEDSVRAAFNFALTRGESLYFKPGDPSLAPSVRQQVDERGFCRIAPDSAEGLAGKQTVLRRAAQAPYEESIALTWNPDQRDEFADESISRAARLYALEMRRLAERHGMRLIFLELPNFRGRPLSPAQVAFYCELGELLEPDKAVLYREESFQDVGHLSVEGATHLSRFVAERLAAPGK